MRGISLLLDKEIINSLSGFDFGLFILDTDHSISPIVLALRFDLADGYLSKSMGQKSKCAILKDALVVIPRFHSCKQ